MYDCSGAACAELLYCSSYLWGSTAPPTPSQPLLSTAEVKLNEGQERAIEVASDAPLMVLTGGPGCGKTTAVQTIVKLWCAQKKMVRIAAPTGELGDAGVELLRCAMEWRQLHACSVAPGDAGIGLLRCPMGAAACMQHCA